MLIGEANWLKADACLVVTELEHTVEMNSIRTTAFQHGFWR